MVGIYKITSPSGRVYIGQSVNIEGRLEDYKWGVNIKSQRKLYRSILKYGYFKHIFEVVEECSIEEVDKTGLKGFTYIFNKKVKVNMKFEDLVLFEKEA